MQKRILWITIALLVLAAIACSLGGKTATPPAGGGGATPTTEPTAEEAPPPQISSDALENLNSYRARIVIRHEKEGSAPETVNIEMEDTREPAAKRIVITFAGTEQTITTELVQIGDQSWMCNPDGGCVQTKTEETSSFGEGIFLDPPEVNTSEYRYLGRETVNGIRSRHYEVKIDPIALSMLTKGEVKSVRAEIWVADEAGMPAYATRYTISWEAVDKDDGKTITGSWTWEVYDVNKPIKIEPPAGATSWPEDIPLYEGASGQMMMGSVLLYSTPAKVADVAEFYRNEMPGLGWTAGAESTLGNTVTQEWKKGNRTISLMISPGEDGTTVMITVQE